MPPLKINVLSCTTYPFQAFGSLLYSSLLSSSVVALLSAPTTGAESFLASFQMSSSRITQLYTLQTKIMGK